MNVLSSFSIRKLLMHESNMLDKVIAGSAARLFSTAPWGTQAIQRDAKPATVMPVDRNLARGKGGSNEQEGFDHR
jgi:hypothetical protein